MTVCFRFVIYACLIALPVFIGDALAGDHSGELIVTENPDGGIEMSHAGPDNDQKNEPDMLVEPDTVTVTMTGSDTDNVIDCSLPENIRAGT